MRKNRKGWVLITGAAKRLGSCMALYLAKEGYSVLVHYNTSQSEADEIVQACQVLGSEARAIQGDFSSLLGVEAFIHQTLASYPNIRYLVNNVGNYLIKTVLDTSLNESADLFQTNLLAPIGLIKGFISSIKHEKGGIVNIGMAGMREIKSNTHHPIYLMTKLSLLSLTKSLARELAPYGVPVNMVSPGYLDIAVDLPCDLLKLPMGRAGSSEEVARVVAFLLDDDSRYITGQNIEVAGAIGL